MDNLELNSEQTKSQIENVGQKWIEGSQEIDWNQICFVRALKNIDQISVEHKDGADRLMALSLLSSTKGELPRVTTHWSINHKVSSHAFGSWNDSSLIIISPGADMVKENGLPFSLAVFDTYWDKDLVIPQGSVVLSGSDLPEKTSRVKGIKFVKISLGEDETEKIKKLEEDYNKAYTKGKVEEGQELEAEYFRESTKLGEVVSSLVNKEMTDLGYTVISGDSGTYTNVLGLDSAVYKLAEKEGITQIGGHTETPIWYLEQAMFLLSLGKNENLTDYREAIRLALFGLDEGRKNEEPISDRSVLAFCGELVNVLRRDPEKFIKSSADLVDALVLFDKFPEIGKIVSQWINNNANSNERLTDIGSIVDFFNFVDESSEVDRFLDGEIGILNLTKDIDQKNHAIMKKVIKEFFKKRYEMQVSTSIISVTEDSYTFKIKFKPW